MKGPRLANSAVHSRRIAEACSRRCPSRSPCAVSGPLRGDARRSLRGPLLALFFFGCIRGLNGSLVVVRADGTVDPSEELVDGASIVTAQHGDLARATAASANPSPLCGRSETSAASPSALTAWASSPRLARSVVVFRMPRGEPQFLELGAHVGIDLPTEVPRKVCGTNEAEDIREILKPVGRGHARSELHLHQAGE